MRGMASGNTENKEINWSILKTLLPYLFEYRLRIILALACLVLAKLASVGLPFILKHIVDDLNQSPELANGGAALLLVPLALLVAYGFVRFANVLFGELRDTLFGRITERAMRRIGLKVFRHLHQLDLNFHLNRRTGGLSRDIERGTHGISFLLRFMVFNIVPTFIEIAMVVGILLFNYSPWYALVVLCAVVSYVGFSVLATNWRLKFIRQANSAESESSTRAIDSLLNYETVKYFTNEKYEAGLYDANLEIWEAARRNNRLSLFALNAGQAFIISASMSAAMILAALDVASGEMTIGDFVLINAFMMQIFMPLNFLGFVYREMKGSMANIEAMFALLDEKASVLDAEGARPLAIKAGEIEFKDVYFAYDSERPILQGVSFKVQQGAKLAVVGGSGAGKSTILKLLFRFYDADSGTITIDGQNIRDHSLESLRQAIGVVPQDSVLFNSSLFENIAYGNVEASEQDVWRAIELAHLKGFIEGLPKKEQTIVGERGLKLSGGEKQRVAIARALLKEPPIMVFDEATSSLDSESEQEILAAIAEIARKQTSIVVAHRLSTVVDADSIVVLEQGKVVEIGTHQGLLAKAGRYATLWELQQSED